MATSSPELSDSTEIPQLEEQPQFNNMAQTDASKPDDGLDKFLQQMRSDTMYELRSIQHSYRPVTGQDHRENLHQFMKKHLCDAEHSKGNVPANVDDVAEHRPESVVVEVQGIVEQRPVSSILQSAAFRHRLENIIRGSLQSSRRSSPSHSREGTPRVTLSAPPRHIQAGRERIPNIQQRTEQPRLERHDSTDSISSVESFSSAVSSIDQDADFQEEEEDVPISASPIRNTPEHSPSPVPVPRRTLAPSARNSPAPSEQGAEEPEAGISWNDISRVHREEIVQEISELLHTRLVSSTLEGEFRATLEVMFQDHVDTNGPAVQQFVQSLPGRGIPRNDFSHLGIEAGNDIDNSDNISIASVSAHSVPYTQTNTFIGREIQSLKIQMKEMMSMIKMTHELQLDIQRSIRQEVSAALAQCSGASASVASTSSDRRGTQPVKDTHCLICLDRHSDSVLYQCGHMCVCYICGKNLMSRKHCCPVCRAPIKDVIRAYKTNVE